ncbi:uncharacterized protein G2W53_006680 [Senna tora]|uniref:Uncharacterized protein n=1 Tax=Senna tora TaxID=362788 RepID=A0A834X686_9FABA|nr:uncharacterized protein G2W53_006680 [Senna tora]
MASTLFGTRRGSWDIDERKFVDHVCVCLGLSPSRD